MTTITSVLAGQPTTLEDSSHLLLQEGALTPIDTALPARLPLV